MATEEPTNHEKLTRPHSTSRYDLFQKENTATIHKKDTKAPSSPDKKKDQ